MTTENKQAVEPLPENRVAASAEKKPKKGNSGGGSVWLPEGSKVYRIGYYDAPGHQVQVSSGTTVKKEAVAKLQEYLAKFRQGDSRPHFADRLTMSEVFTDVILDYRTNERSTLDDAVIRVREHLGPFFKVRVDTDAAGIATFSGGTRGAGVSNADAQAYIVMRRGEGAKDSTISNELSLLRRALNLAEQNRKLHHAPKLSLPASADRPRTGFIKEPQYRALLSYLPERVRPVVVLGFYTGMRRGELVGLKWNQVDLERRVIKLTAEDTKTRFPRTVPLGQEPLEALREQKRKRDALCQSCQHVFFREARPNEIGGAPKLVPLGEFEKSWQDACEAAGLGTVTLAEYTDIKGKKRTQRHYSGLLFHDLRRSAVRNMIRAGVAPHVAMKVSGPAPPRCLRATTS